MRLPPMLHPELGTQSADVGRGRTGACEQVRVVLELPQQRFECYPLVVSLGRDARRQLPERRYALPSTVSFVELLALDFYRAFHQPLMVDSAIRPATTQRMLHLKNAASAYGPKASSHERGTTVDISKRLTKAQRLWLVTRLLYYRALGQVLVIQERGCFHIFVRGEQQCS